MSKPPPQRPTLRGVVFDMDGTLTVPNLDFPEMYRRCGIDPAHDILQVISELPVEQAKDKLAIIHEMEEEAVNTMQLMPGAIEVANWLKTHHIPTAVVTRNTLQSVQVLRKHIDNLEIIVTRDHADKIAPKPDPAALHYICKQWKVEPANLVMVGDSPANDIGFGIAAGTRTALLGHQRSTVESEKSAAVPDIFIEHLHKLPGHLWRNFHIESNLGTDVPLKKYEVPKPSEPVTIAAAAGDLEALLRYDRQDLEKPDATGNTPLIWAADAGRAQAVELLLLQLQKTNDGTNDGAFNVNARGYVGATAVCRAARRGHLDVLRLLVAAGADLDIPNDKLQYPLHFAAFKEHPEVVEFLLNSGANTRVLDRKGRVPAEDTKCEKIRDRILAAMHNV